MGQIHVVFVFLINFTKIQYILIHIFAVTLNRHRAARVLTELKAWISANKDVTTHFPVEIRFVKEDDIMLSLANGEIVASLIS